jgi:hypothetical protein
MGQILAKVLESLRIQKTDSLFFLFPVKIAGPEPQPADGHRGGLLPVPPLTPDTQDSEQQDCCLR